MRIGVLTYVVPFVFAYRPALLLKGSLAEIAMVLVFTTLGCLSLGGGLVGFTNTGWLQRFMLLIAALLLFIPVTHINLTGTGVFLLVLLWYLSGRHKQKG